MAARNIFGVTGWKNSGKTTLLEALVRHLTACGLRVSTVKHAHHAFDIDVPGKDSYRHRMAGAGEVIVASGQRWALMHELRGHATPALADLLSHLSPCDLVLVEGFKRDAHPKIEVVRTLGSGGRIADGDDTIRAIAAPDAALAGMHKWLPLDEIGVIADFVLAQVGLLGA
ncbi:MAG: molybdopterin-guanine dinucleotide biosynthesis protein B [Proteobacteria bacterium]|nr:molybdopterin-guanine dinucleotide biosynthesis protein B [Pseudomonadota bacterium]